MKPDDLQSAIAAAVAARFDLADLSPTERDRVVAIVTNRFHASMSQSKGAGHIRATLLKPAFLDQEILLGLQTTMQEVALQRSRELLSTIKAGFEGLVADISSFFAALEATEKRLTIASTAGRNLPPAYRTVDTETEAATRARLRALGDERGWTLPVGSVRNVEDGIRAVLSERFPNSVEADFQAISSVVRDRAVDLLQSNDGKWPKGSKGNWYVRQIDELMTTNPGLFAAVLIRN